MSPVRESPFEPATSLEVDSNSVQIAQQNHFASQGLFISPPSGVVEAEGRSQRVGEPRGGLALPGRRRVLTLCGGSHSA